MITTTSSCLYLALPISEDCARQQQLFADRKRERNTRIFFTLRSVADRDRVLEVESPFNSIVGNSSDAIVDKNHTAVA